MRRALANLSDALTGLVVSSGQSYPSLCHKIRTAESESASSCLVSTHLAGRTQTMTFSFDSGFGREAFTSALQGKTFYLGGDMDVVRFETKAKEEKIGEMRSGKWIAYAIRALVLRFWELAKVRAPSS